MSKTTMVLLVLCLVCGLVGAMLVKIPVVLFAVLVIVLGLGLALSARHV